jgi:CBS domain-containing protein
MKTIRQVMRPSFLTLVETSTTVLDAVRIMAQRDIGIVAVMERNRLVGVFSERDVVRRVVERGLDPAQVTVDRVMTQDLVVGDVHESCQTAMRKMDQANIRHLPVVDNGELVSMLSIRDLMRAEIVDSEVELEHLKAYLYQVPNAVVPRPL